MHTFAPRRTDVCPTRSVRPVAGVPVAGIPVGAALVAEATRRSGVAWLVAEGVPHPQLVWQRWLDGAAYLVHGGAEQRLDGVRPGGRVLVVVRSRDRLADRVVQWWADVAQVDPGSDAWTQVVPLLHAQRLNPPDGAAQPERWARESTVLRLTPDGTGEPVDRG